MGLGSRSTAQAALQGRDLTGTTYVVTGGSSGIGAETVRVLAEGGAHVISLARNTQTAGKQAQNALSPNCKGTVSVERLDLTDLEDVKRCSNEIASKQGRIDAVILNAGVMACPLGRTKQDFETQIGTNHLGHYAFAQPLVQKMKQQGSPGRIVVVSSEAHKFGSIDLEDLNWKQRKYNAWGSYGQSKLANILYGKSLSRRLEGSNVTAYSLHPGIIFTPLYQHSYSLASLKGRILQTVMYPFSKSVPQGAATSVYCATAPGIEQHSGAYFSNCKVTAPRGTAEDMTVAEKLWQLSEQLTGVRYAT